MLILQIGGTFLVFHFGFFRLCSLLPASPWGFTELIFLGISYIQVYSFAARYKLVCFLSACIFMTNPVKNHGYWDALILPTSVCFEMLPLPHPLPGLLPPGSSIGVGTQGKWLALQQLSVVPDFLKPSHHGVLLLAASLKRRWQNIAQLGVKPVLWAAVTWVGVWSLKMSAHSWILFVSMHLFGVFV